MAQLGAILNISSITRYELIQIWTKFKSKVMDVNSITNVNYLMLVLLLLAVLPLVALL